MTVVLLAVCLFCLALFGVQGFGLAGLICLCVWIYCRSLRQSREFEAERRQWEEIE